MSGWGAFGDDFGAAPPVADGFGAAAWGSDVSDDDSGAADVATTTAVGPEVLDSVQAELEATASKIESLSLATKQQRAAPAQSTAEEKTSSAAQEDTEQGTGKKKKKRRKRKKKAVDRTGQTLCINCSRWDETAEGSQRKDKWYCSICKDMRKCDECFKWVLPDDGKADADSASWFCNGCWSRYNSREKAEFDKKDSTRFASAKMRRMEKQWAKGGQW